MTATHKPTCATNDIDTYYEKPCDCRDPEIGVGSIVMVQNSKGEFVRAYCTRSQWFEVDHGGGREGYVSLHFAVVSDDFKAGT